MVEYRSQIKRNLERVGVELEELQNTLVTKRARGVELEQAEKAASDKVQEMSVLCD